MLTPDYLDVLPGPIIDLYEEYQQSVINDIARRLAKLDYASPTAAWQMQRAIESGKLYDDILEKLASITGKSESTLRTLFKDAGVKAMAFDDEIYRRAGLQPLPLNLSPAMTQVLSAGLERTQGLMRNLTQTTAVTGQDAFISAADLAYMQVSSGAFDYNSAIRQAVNKVAAEGLSVINYASGRRDQLDVAMRRTVLTGINQTSSQLQMARVVEMNTDLIAVSAHIGARNTGTGPANHESWQGKVYKVNGQTAKYKNFAETTGYGTGEGLGGWNCRHSFYPFFEGISENAYSREELKSFANKTVTYNGKEISVYEATQIQRGMERKVRFFKRQAGALNVAGLDASKEMNNLKLWQANLRSFTKQTGLPRQYSREWIYGIKKESVEKLQLSDYISADKNVEIKEKLSNMTKNKFTDNEKQALADYSAMRYKEINGVLRGDIELSPKVDIQPITYDDEFSALLGFDNTPSAPIETYDIEKAISNIDSAINKSSGLPDNIILHRGFGSEEIYNMAKNNVLKPGGTFQDKAYMSTSLQKSTADVFSSREYPVMLEIYGNKGAKCIFMNSEEIGSAFTSEAEILLPRNAKSKIISFGIEKDEFGREIAKILLNYQ